MSAYYFKTITASQLLAMLLLANINDGNNGENIALDFCLRKSANSGSRARGSTKFEVLLLAKWVGNNGGVFFMADESGKLLNFKIDQFVRWLSKLGSGTIGQKVRTSITFTDLSDLGRPMGADAAATALQAFTQWSGNDKLQADIDKTNDTLNSWGVQLIEPESQDWPPEPVLFDWWQSVADNGKISAEVQALSGGEAADLGSEEVRGIFEAAKGGRSTRNSDKKESLAIKGAILQNIKQAQTQIGGVISSYGRPSDIYGITGDFSSGGNDGGYGEY